MKTIVLFLLLLTGVVQAKAQLVDVIFESVGEGPLDDPFFGNPLPAGYTAYRIYARLQDPTDRISAVFGSESPGPTHTLKLGSSLVPNSIYNNSGGGFAGETPNCALFSLAPAIEFDSYITIGQASNCPECVGLESGIFQITDPPNQINASFAGGGLGQDLTIINGSWFLPNDGSCNGFGQGPDNRVLIAQVTIPTGTLEYWLNIAIFDEAVGANQLIYVHTMEDAPGLVGSIQEIDGTCMGLVFPPESVCAPIEGCTDNTACNFNPAASIDDGSCAGVAGCADPEACNYVIDPDCNSVCYYPGCIDQEACNYNAQAGCDNGTCTYTLINGYIFHDADGNGLYFGFGFGEPTFFNWSITMLETGITVYSDENGYYEFPQVPDGEYTLQLNDNNEIWEPSTTDVLIVTSPSCTAKNFGLVPVDQTLLMVGAPCCIWSMNIHCTNGFNPGLWIYNEGSTELHGTFTISCSDILTVASLWNSNNPDLIEPGLITWNIDQGIGQNELYQCHINGPGAEYIGQAFPFELHLVLYDDENNIVYDNSWTLTPIVVCAYDPNDKYAEPEGYSEEHFVLPDGTIEYRIRFQNTGNFPAEDIVVVDQLDINVLDVSTFEPQFASANFSSCIHDDGLVEFMFNDINLPDSTSDEPGSQGFVVFQIRPIESLEPGTVINNTASIYFDGNPPIITNTTWHTIFNCTSFTGIEGADSFCINENGTFTSFQNYVESYDWQFDGQFYSNQSEIELPMDLVGDHVLEVTVGNPLCTETNELNFTVHPLPIADAGNDQDVCSGDIITVSATGGTSFEWDNGLGEGASHTFEITESVTLTVMVTSEFNCSASDEISVLVHPVPQTSITQEGLVLTGPAGVSWQWYLDNELIDGANDQTLTTNESGTYSVVTTNEFGCSSQSEEILVVIYISESSDSEFSIFPNPSLNSATLKFPTGKWDISITDVHGNLVQVFSNVNGNAIEISTDLFSRGNYFVQFRNEMNQIHFVKMSVN